MRPGTLLGYRWVVEDRLAGRPAWTPLRSYPTYNEALSAASLVRGGTRGTVRVRRAEIRKAMHVSMQPRMW